MYGYLIKCERGSHRSAIDPGNTESHISRAKHYSASVGLGTFPLNISHRDFLSRTNTNPIRLPGCMWTKPFSGGCWVLGRSEKKVRSISTSLHLMCGRARYRWLSTYRFQIPSILGPAAHASQLPLPTDHISRKEVVCGVIGDVAFRGRHLKTSRTCEQFRFQFVNLIK